MQAPAPPFAEVPADVSPVLGGAPKWWNEMFCEVGREEVVAPQTAVLLGGRIIVTRVVITTVMPPDQS